MLLCCSNPRVPNDCLVNGRVLQSRVIWSMLKAPLEFLEKEKWCRGCRQLTLLLILPILLCGSAGWGDFPPWPYWLIILSAFWRGKESFINSQTNCALYSSFKVLLLCAFRTSDFNLVDYSNGALITFALPTWAWTENTQLSIYSTEHDKTHF